MESREAEVAFEFCCSGWKRSQGWAGTLEYIVTMFSLGKRSRKETAGTYSAGLGKYGVSMAQGYNIPLPTSTGTEAESPGKARLGLHIDDWFSCSLPKSNLRKHLLVFVPFPAPATREV